MKNRLAIVVPIYKSTLNLLEQFSVDYLTKKTARQDLIFIAPHSLDVSYYISRYPNFSFVYFDDFYFRSISGYNQLMLSDYFYEKFVNFEYILIHQTDALLFKDDLDEWMNQGYDYIGAPWPHGMSLNLGNENAHFFGGSTFHAYVGNGGLSLRSIASSRSILKEAKLLHQYWCDTCLNEDCFFAFSAVIIGSLRIPQPSLAARFSLELEPEIYIAVNSGDYPTGCHAWWKHNLPFWQKIISIVG